MGERERLREADETAGDQRHGVAGDRLAAEGLGRAPLQYVERAQAVEPGARRGTGDDGVEAERISKFLRLTKAGSAKLAITGRRARAIGIEYNPDMVEFARRAAARDR